MQWAHVQFHIDKVKANVPFNFIEDYDKYQISIHKVRYVFWSNDPEDTPESLEAREIRLVRVDNIKKRSLKGKSEIPGWYKATVHLIADSEEELEAELERKRLNINIQPEGTTSTSAECVISTSFDKKKLSEEAKRRNEKKLLKRTRTDMEDEDDTNDGFPIDEEDPELMNGNYIREEEVNTIKRRAIDLQKSNKDLRKKNTELENRVMDLERARLVLRKELKMEKTKNEKLSELNLRYQEKVVFGRDERNAITSKQSHEEFILRKEPVNPRYEESSSISIPASPPRPVIYENEDYGVEIQAKVEKYTTIEMIKRITKSCKPGERGDAIFIKNLAATLWAPEQLMERSAQGIACPTKKGEPARQECTPEKKDLMKLLLENRAKQDGDKPEERVKKLNQYLSQKISTLRRDARNKLLK